MGKKKEMIKLKDSLSSKEMKKKQQCVKILSSSIHSFLSFEQCTKKNESFPGPRNSCLCVYFHPLWYFPVCPLNLALREALEEGRGCQKHAQGDSESRLLCFRLSTQ